MALDSEKAFRIFLVSGLPQAYTYRRVIRRQEEREDRERQKSRREDTKAPQG